MSSTLIEAIMKKPDNYEEALKEISKLRIMCAVFFAIGFLAGALTVINYVVR